MKSKIEKFRVIILLICGYLVTTMLCIHGMTAHANAQKNLAVIFIVDDSGSMDSYDPENLRYTAVKLMISSLDSSDKVGFIRFSTESEIVTDGFVKIISEETKLSLIDMIKVPVPEGYTNFLAALQDAQSILENADDLTAHKTIIVFLTDGYPYPAVSYPRYLDDVISLSKDLSVPIYAIALTPEGQSAVLSQMAQISGGRLIFANTAEDLLDSYLQILGELKDRTIIKGEVSEPGEQILFIDPALMPYVSKISFIAAHPPDCPVNLVLPSGIGITETNPAIDYIMQDDPAFTVFSLNTIQGGIWKMAYSGCQFPQVRAILYSRLRAKILEPENVFQSGRPITFVVNLIEELSDGSTRKIVGEADFSAEIILPDGSKQSLDRFYDNGSYGDAVANDGNFSRQFMDTNQSGTYNVTISGRKDIIAVETYRLFSAIDVPQRAFVEPRFDYYEITDEVIPIEFSFDFDDFKEEYFEGKLSAHITDPQKNLTIVPLIQTENIFRANFQPLHDGNFEIAIDFSEAYYLGVQIFDEISKHIEVKLIPTLIVGNHYFDVDRQITNPQFNLEDIYEGIPLVINIYSTSSQQEFVSVTAEGIAGFSIQPLDPILIEPNNDNKVAILLKPDGMISSGSWTGSLTVRPKSNVNVSQTFLPINFSIVRPVITFAVNDLIVEPQKPLCFRIQPIKVFLTAFSTSMREEAVSLTISGIEGAELVGSNQYLMPGENSLEITLNNLEALTSGKYTGTLNFSSSRDSLLLQNAQGGDDLRFSFVIDSIWQRCMWTVVSGLVLGFFIFIIIKIILRRIRRLTRKPKVLGTLIYWNRKTPDEPVYVDINAMESANITVGRSSDCDIFINDSSVKDEHFKLIANREDRTTIIRLYPQGEVVRGYRRVNEPIEIEEDQIYGFGEYEFRFVSDPNLI